MIRVHRIALLIGLTALTAGPAIAQYDVQWLEFTPGPGRIKNPDATIATHITNDTEEKDFAWGDVNHDGWTDLVIVRKTPASFPGLRVNYLLINELGTLVDRTAQYASESDVPGDMGFLTPTDDRDVELVDMNLDGWLDILISTKDLIAAAEPKHITHPRIYINKGSTHGEWQGFRYEDARIPLLMVGAIPGTVRFCDAAFGDVTGDGYPDLYFSDYDLTENGFPEAAGSDLNDRLLINDGNGYFTDQTAARMASQMTLDAFGTSCAIVDMNMDGRNDIVRLTTLTTPPTRSITIAYNDALSTVLPNGVGMFDIYDGTTYAAAPYHVSIGDLNNDGRPDIMNSDDGTDGYRFNTGVDALGRATFSAIRTVTWLAGSGEDGFTAANKIADFDNDGWNDVIICDFDVDVLGCNRRTKIYHNHGGTPGSTAIDLVEEKQQAGAGGWFGAMGLLPSDMTGGFDAAIFDIDNDGDLDLVMGRCSGTFVWMNRLYQAPAYSTYCYGDGSGAPCPCGNNSVAGQNEGCLSSSGRSGKLYPGGVARVTGDTLALAGSRLPNGGPSLFFEGTTTMSAGAGLAFGDGKLCVNGTIVRLGVKFNSPTGTSSYPSGADPILSVAGLVVPGDTRTYQVWYRDSAVFCTTATYNLTNGCSITWSY